MTLYRLPGRGYLIVMACLAAALASMDSATHAQGTSQLGGWVYIDRNNDGELAFGDSENPEYVIGDVSISLYSKANNLETLVSTQLTDPYGRYLFQSLSPGTYVLRQTQPVEFVDGKDTLGHLISLNGQPIPPTDSPGTATDNAFLNIVLSSFVGGDFYNFGERGLKAGYASKRFLLASTPPPNTAIPEPSTALLTLGAIGAATSYRGLRRKRS